MSDEDSDTTQDEDIDTLEELRNLFNLSPLALEIEPGWDPPSPPNPFWFYDKHIDPKLTLLRVKHMPSLVGVISSTTDEALQNLMASRADLPVLGYSSRFYTASNRDVYPPIVTDASSVADLYYKSVANYCVPVASTLAIHPFARNWMTAIRWSKGYKPTLPSPANAAEHYSLRIMVDRKTGKVDLVPRLLAQLDETTVNKLQEVQDRCPDLGTWEFMGVSEITEGLLRDMNQVMKSDFFNSEICNTRGYPLSRVFIQPPPDAKSGPCVVPTLLAPAATIEHNPPRRSERLSTAKRATGKTRKLETAARKSRPSAPSNVPPTDIGNTDENSNIYPAMPSDYETLTPERLIQHVSSY
jgi:hypothetical protein